MTEDVLYSSIVEVLNSIHSSMPDLRFGEVIQNSVDKRFGKRGTDLHRLSSKEILSSLQTYYTVEKNKRGIE